MKDHPGFAAVQAQISKKSGVPMKNAGAILAAGARKASPAAKKKNPRLLKVGGAKKPNPIAGAINRSMMKGMM